MMAGGSRNHAAIAVDTATALSNRLRPPCRADNSDFMVEVTALNRFYPDVSVACGERRDFTNRPALIVEVRSPVVHHVLDPWQDQPRARLWRPAVDGGAQPLAIDGLDKVIELPNLEMGLPMTELHTDVDVAL